MKIKDIILPFSLAIITTFFIQNYFFSSRTAEKNIIVSGQQFVAPQTQTIKPLNREIDFFDVTAAPAITTTVVDTPCVTYNFSTAGAALESISFKREIEDNVYIMQTIAPLRETEREKKCFLLALDQKTPYYYILKAFNENDLQAELVYEAELPSGILQKQFVVSKTHYTIHLSIRFIYHENSEKLPLEFRLFYAAPYMENIADRDQISGIYANENDAVKKVDISSINELTGWYGPTLFGADNRYFIHALIDDADHFAQRAYYSVQGNRQSLRAIVEGPTVRENSQWDMTFYLGPKEQEALTMVDQRLTQTLDYSGILAPIAKFLLMILKWLYKYLGNYGWAIIALTCLIRLILMPFAFRMHQGMKKQKEMQKKLAYIKRKFKDDKQSLTHAQAELIKEHGLPGIGGCLPLLFQIPVMIALNRILSSAIELYYAPFLIWKDLSVPDPYYIFPIFIALGTMAQSLITEDQNQRIMLLMSGMIFGVLAAKFPAGLTMYFCVGTLLHLLQTVIQQRFIKQS